MEFYQIDELCRVVNRSASILQVPIDEGGATEIARRSRGTPRIANRILRRVRDFAQVQAQGVITESVAADALQLEGIDRQGLMNLDRKFLQTIIHFYKGGPVGLEAIAATLQEESETLVDMVEPFLLKIGFLNGPPRAERPPSAPTSIWALKPRRLRKGSSSPFFARPSHTPAAHDWILLYHL